MAIKFFHADPDFLPVEAFEFLRKAAENNNYFEVSDALRQSRNGVGKIFCVYNEKKLVGSFFLNFKTNHIGRIINLVLLGGMEIEKWKDDLSAFLNDFCKKNKATEFMLLGRRGWERMFPELEYVSCVLRKKF